MGAPWHAGARDEVLVPLHLLVGICVYSVSHFRARDAAVLLASLGYKHLTTQQQACSPAGYLA